MPCIGGHPLKADLVIVSGIADGEVGYLSSASADGIENRGKPIRFDQSERYMHN